MKRIKSFLERTEVWFIDNDLHIYFGIMTIVVVSCMSWMLYTEIEKSDTLRLQNLQLLSEIAIKDREIVRLNSEIYLSKISTSIPVVSPVVARPVTETVEKVSNKLNDKIEKVQDSLIKSPDTRTITKTQVQTVEKPVPVDAELRTMMRQSFCTSFPEDKLCKKVKK